MGQQAAENAMIAIPREGTRFPRDELIATLKDRGVGEIARSNGPGTTTESDAGIIVMNAVDPEPLLKNSRWTLEKEPEAVLQGMLLLMRSWPASRAVAAVPRQELPRFHRF